MIRLPPDPPEKWQTVQSALETTEKTRRLCAILLLDKLAVGAIVVAVVVVVLLWH
jgi:hypothetical protein